MCNLLMTTKSLKRLESGGLPLIYWAIKKLGLKEILDDYLSKHGNEKVAISDSLILILYNLTIGKRPLYELENWCSKINPHSIGNETIDCDILNDDRFGRALDKLYEADRSSLMTDIVIKMVKKFELNLDRIHNDSTTAKTHGEVTGKTKDGLELKRGHSKDHRPDLKQLVFCMSIAADGAVPIHFKAYSGNVTDDKTHIETWETIRKIKGDPNFIYVGDCKVCTNQQLNYIASNGGKVVTIIPSTWKEVEAFKSELRECKKDKIEILRKPLPSQTYNFIPEEKKKLEYYCTFPGEYKTANGYKIHWIFSSEKKNRDEEQREDFLIKTEAMLAELNSKLNVRKYKSKEIISEGVNSILSTNKMERFFEINITTKEAAVATESEKAPEAFAQPYFYLTWSRKHGVIKKEKNVDGIFPLLTTDHELKAIDVLNYYKFQPRIEKRFSQLKSFHNLMPILFKKVERIEATMFLYFLCMMVQALIEREVRTNMVAKSINYLKIYPEEMAAFRPTTPIILENFEGISRTLITNEYENIEEIKDELSQTQILTLEMLGMNSTDYWKP